MADAARAGVPPNCSSCGLAAVLEEDDLVDVQCKMSGCLDGKTVVYHRACLESEYGKMGRQRDSNYKSMQRAIERMELVGLKCIHSRHGPGNPGFCKGHVGYVLLRLKPKKVAPLPPPASAPSRPKAPAAAKPPLHAAGHVTRKPVKNYGSMSNPNRAVVVEAAPAPSGPREVVGAEFADESAKRKRAKAAASAALAEEDRHAAARARALGGAAPAMPTHWAGAGAGKAGNWWNNLMAMDAAAHESQGAAGGGPGGGGAPSAGWEAEAGWAAGLEGPGSSDPDAIFAQLLDMGYGEEDASTYSYQCSTVEAAIQAIDTKTDPAFLLAMRAYEEQEAARAAACLSLTASAASDADLARRLQVQANTQLGGGGGGGVGGGGGGGGAGADEWVAVRKKESKQTALAQNALALDPDTAAVLKRLLESGKIKTSEVSKSALACLLESPPEVSLEVVSRLEKVLAGGQTIKNLSRWIAGGVQHVLDKKYGELGGEEGEEEEEEEAEGDDASSQRSHNSRASHNSSRRSAASAASAASALAASALPPALRLLDPRVRAAYLALLRRLGLGPNAGAAEGALDDRALDFMRRAPESGVERLILILGSIQTTFRGQNLSSFLISRFTKFKREDYAPPAAASPPRADAPAPPPRPPQPPTPPLAAPQPHAGANGYAGYGGFSGATASPAEQYDSFFSHSSFGVAAQPPPQPPQPPAPPMDIFSRPWLAPLPSLPAFYDSAGTATFLPPPVEPARGYVAAAPQAQQYAPAEAEEEEDDDLRYMLNALQVRA